jgi:hypothetical protein
MHATLDVPTVPLLHVPLRLRQIRVDELHDPTARDVLRLALNRVLDHSSGYTADWVFRKSLSGDMMLLEIQQHQDDLDQDPDLYPRRHPERIGYIVAQIDTHSELPVLYLFGVEITDEHRMTVVDYQGLSHVLNLLAARKGCTVVRAKSPRPGWSRVAERLGFVPIAIEYERAVEKEVVP